MQTPFSLRRIGALAAALLLSMTVSRQARAEATAAAAPPVDPIENSVVKVFATLRYPNPSQPWIKQPPREITASGVVIEGKRILTNAHVALYASQVQIQASQSGDKLSATVEFVAPGIDLAVLKVDDESFFATHTPLARAKVLPEVKDAVMVYGYPTGGTTLSITKGIVSRIEFVAYNFPTSGLRIQLDAAINPGNSGGPAMAGDKMIGLAFSHLGGAENIGYIIPCEEIELFLADIADGHYDGKPAMFDQLQTFENPALRPFLKLGKSVSGMIVTEPESTDAAYPLKTWDVITKIGDRSIGNDGMVQIAPNLRVHFQYLVQQVAKDGKLPLTIIRAGRTMEIALPVASKRPMLVKEIMGEYPPYFILGPMVFSTGNSLFFSMFAAKPQSLIFLSVLENPLVTRRGERPAFPGEELVVVSAPYFPNRLAVSYSNSAGRVVDSVNGIAIKNLRHLVEVLRDSRDEFLTFKFAGHAELLVFPREAMIKATDDILADNDVRAQASPDLLEVWRAKH